MVSRLTHSVSENPETALARAFVLETGSHLFLTGKAGTGKTTFLKQLEKDCPKRMVIAAPTGVAAVNAGGVTLHSFFQLPMGPCVPGTEFTDAQRRRMFRFSREKRQMIRSMDLLVIDEISMVRGDLLDAVDEVLRRLRRDNAPFGGVQLLMIGDLQQLPPVVTRQDAELLGPYYSSPYFFSSKALAETRLVTIELQTVYRQSDPAFIRLLNDVRDNRLTPSSLALLDQQCNPSFVSQPDDGYITLTTHNQKARHINEARLSELTGASTVFDARVSGEFPEHSFPTPAHLVLKKGAQVMFLRNDPSPDKLFFNGRIGRVTTLNSEEIRVRCPGDPDEISVTPVEWHNVRYTIDDTTREITTETVGRFEQFPLKLAWAVTIHKSQGLTFDRVVIDAGSAFAPGQVYVALSRCRTLEGMVLHTPIPRRGMDVDPPVRGFLDQVRQSMPDSQVLAAEKVMFQQRLLLSCFDFSSLRSTLFYLTGLILGNARAVQVTGLKDPRALREQAQKEIFQVGERFQVQLKGIFEQGYLPETHDHTLERIARASEWFQARFQACFEPIEAGIHVETDNRSLARRIHNALKHLRQEIRLKQAAVKMCENGFSPVDYLKAVAMAELEEPEAVGCETQLPEYGESDIEHGELFARLKSWRNDRAKTLGVRSYQVLKQQILIQVSVQLPDTKAALRRISGVGPKTMENYGDEILGMVQDYRKEKNIKKVMLHPPQQTSPGSSETDSGDEKAKTAPLKKAPGTRDVTLCLHEKGLSPEQIAAERGLAESTIYSHFAHHVAVGRLDVSDLLPAEKLKKIESEIRRSGIAHPLEKGDLGTLKSALGDGISYGEIRLILAQPAKKDAD